MTMRILFVCTGNSARSQMAESWARQLASPGVEVRDAIERRLREWMAREVLLSEAR